ncbi:MAG: hypothetical protein GC205_13480 [Bacteroidetes bacterium]|nr:hypothetical protein [Bacteroidota bacterium]
MARLLLLLFTVLSALVVQGQEVLRSAGTNPALGQVAQTSSGSAGWQQRSGGGTRDTLCLPFFDDFSNPRRWLGNQGGPCTDTVHPTQAPVFPNNLFWADRGAFINATYPENPPSFGVATLDGLNARGKPYNEATPFGPADTLTSKPIFLGGTLTDSIFLSFYYQPGGRGDSPDSQDSLLLQCRLPDSTWITVWSALNDNGTLPDPFRLVMINLTGPEFRYDGFQFRFRNYATRSGNNDHWHLDYVLLDDDRGRGDTLFRDVSFSEPPASMIRPYHSMPWLQFRNNQAAFLRPAQEARAFNLFNTAINTNFQDSLLESSTLGLVGLTASESAAVPAGGYYTYVHNNPEIPASTPNYDEDSLSLTWKLRLRPSGDIDPFNDTLLFRQDFYNYYAYDDGSAERAYGLIGTGAKLAYRFATSTPDSLYAVYIHWSFINGNLGDKFFSLLVYQNVDTTGLTDTDSILYQEDFLVPKYPDSVNGWWVYNLEQPVAVDGIFYIGWLQSQEDLLNVGFDRNTAANRNLYFNLGDAWLQSSLVGSVMMRPQVGPNYRVYPTLGVNAAPATSFALKVWPNPAQDVLMISVAPGQPEGGLYRICNLQGSAVLSGRTSVNRIDIAGLAPGMYLLEWRSGYGGGEWGGVTRFVRSP